MGSRVKLRAEVPPLPIELSSHLVTPGPFRPADLESELGFVSHLKNSSSNASRGREGPEPFPKTATYCHLLPFSSRKIATPVATVPFLPYRSSACRPAWDFVRNQSVSGLATVSIKR